MKRLEPKEVPRGTVLLGHAMFNSHAYFFQPKDKSLADFFCTLGYRVVAFDLTGYGANQRADVGTDFDSYVADYASVIAALPDDAPLHYVGHSVGGVAGLSAISQGNRDFATVTLVCPALWGQTLGAPLTGLLQRVQLKGASLLAHALGRLPTRAWKLGDTDAPPGYLRQLHAWAASGEVCNHSGAHYPDSWKKCRGRVRVLQAENDPWMAPPANVDWIMQRLPKSSERLTIGKENGFIAKHFSILYGREARQFVWPKLAVFVENG